MAEATTRSPLSPTRMVIVGSLIGLVGSVVGILLPGADGAPLPAETVVEIEIGSIEFDGSCDDMGKEAGSYFRDRDNDRAIFVVNCDAPPG